MTPATHLVHLLQSIRNAFPAVTYHPDDPHRAAIEAAAADMGLACVPDPKTAYREIRGCAGGAGAVTAPPLNPPPPGVPVRSEWGDVIWHDNGDGDWYGQAPNGTHPTATWRELASGKYGPLEMLVPVPMRPGPGTDEEILGAALDQLMGPVIDAMEHLGAAAVAGFRALLGDAVRRGERRGEQAAADHSFPILNVQGQMSPGIQELLREISREQARSRGSDDQ